MDYSTSSLKLKREAILARGIQITNSKPSEAGLNLRGEAVRQGSESAGGEAYGRFTEFASRASTRSSCKERKGNALASGADEGRDKLR